MTIRDHVVLLVGGVGGAKLALGLSKVLPPESLTIIVNTADDFEHLSVHISPDLDTVMYTLAGLANPATGWGIEGDSFQAIDMVNRYGGADWFRLGDKDIGTNLYRTHLLRQGHTLTQVTGHLSTRLGVQHPILPMSDDPVRTILETDHGVLGFQEYFVRERWQPVVKHIHFEGAETARPSPAVSEALDQASLIVFGPSNPFLSIDPILAVPGIRGQIATRPCVAVSPIIGGKAVKGPAAKLMTELGMDVSPWGVAKHYEELLNGIILDIVDQDLCQKIEKLGMHTKAQPTLMKNLPDKIHLATVLLNWTEEKLS
jgi:LPPG:FO 2-phospho-L-lactate transferase